MTLEELIRECGKEWSQQASKAVSDEAYYRGAADAAGHFLSQIDTAKNGESSDEEAGQGEDSQATASPKG